VGESGVIDKLSESVLGDRSVKPFELFFDLVFVFAFTQVTQLLAHELSWVGLGQGVLLIAALWLAWQSYVWLGTMIDVDDGAVRLVMLVVMGAMLAGALAVPHAFSNGAVFLRWYTRSCVFSSSCCS